MRVALHDSDRTRFPNLPLMKLSAWHRAHGDTVEQFIPLMNDSYDRVYSSKVFSFTDEEPNLPRGVIRGGTGYGPGPDLPDNIEHIMPDYSLYPAFQASLGFVTRGCMRSCPWCVVPTKEGVIRAHAELEEFLRPGCRDVVLMDNNILAHPHGVAELERSIVLNLRIDCNQGLDVRLIATDDALAKMLSRIHWIRFIRIACDRLEQMADVERAVTRIRHHGHKKYEFFCYLLVQEDVNDALERAEFLRNLNVRPFAQPYRAPGSKSLPTRTLRNFARWVNHKAIFHAIPWSEYRGGAA